MVYIILLLSVVLSLILIKPIYFYVKLKRSGLKIILKKCIKMSFQKTLNNQIVDSILLSHKQELPITIDNVITQFLASRNPINIVNAMTLAIKNGHQVSFDKLSTADLLGLSLDSLVNKLDEKQTLTLRKSFNNRKDNSFDVQTEIEFTYTFSGLTFPETIPQDGVEKSINSIFSNVLQLWTDPVDEDLIRIISDRIERAYKDDFVINNLEIKSLIIT